MRESPELQDLYAALSLAQGEIENAAKESENPGFKRGNKSSKYADLASVRDAYRIPFAKHGLALLQIPTVEAKTVTILTRLTHKSGQFIEEPMSMDAVNGTPQAIGSTITYIRRYAAMCFSGVAPEDDDGNAASGVGQNDHDGAPIPPRPPNPTQSRVPQYLSDAQADKLLGMIKECGKGTWDQFAKEFGIDRLSAIPANKYDGCIAWLSGRLQAQSSAKATVAPPNPGKPASAPPQPAQSASINFDAFRSALRAAATQDDINAIWDREVEARKPPLSDDEADEAQAILREESSKFWTKEDT